jgi:hypothetical protein
VAKSMRVRPCLGLVVMGPPCTACGSIEDAQQHERPGLETSDIHSGTSGTSDIVLTFHFHHYQHLEGIHIIGSVRKLP